MEMEKRRVLACTLTLAAMAGLGTLALAAPELPPGYQSFDLAQLRDGETREFGQGDHLVSATRAGDVVTIQRPSGDQHYTVRCEVARDHCSVGIPADPSGRPLVVVTKERKCVNGRGDCADIATLAGDAGGAYEVTVVRDEYCDGTDADCENVRVVRIGDGDGPHTLVIHGDGDDSADSVSVRKIVMVPGGEGDGPVQVITSGADGGTAVWTGADGGEHPLAGHAWSFVTGSDAALGTVLRCPEGDTTMRVSKDEADQTFLCPKHHVALEKVHAASLVIDTKTRKQDAAPKN